MNIFLLLTSTLYFAAADFAETSYLQCVDGVEVISMPGSVPGYIILTDPNAFGMVMSNDVILAAGGVLGGENGGRVIAFGHGGFVSLADTDTTTNGVARLLLNSVKWSGKSATPHIAIQQGASHATDMSSKFTAEGFTFATVSDSAVLAGSLLSNFDLLIAESAHYSSPDAIAALRAFLSSGKGIIFYGTSWAFDYPNGFVNELDYPANRVLQDTGVVITGQYNWDASSSPWSVSPTFDDQIGINAGTAVARLTEAYTNSSITMMATEEALAYDAIDYAIRRIADSASGQLSFFNSLYALSDIVKASVSLFSYPTGSNPFLTESDPGVTFVVMLENDLAYGLSARELKAHPSHADFPGPTPPAAPVTRTFTFNGNYEGLNTNLIYSGASSGKWHSTGLYLPAGVLANVTIASGRIHDGLSIQVGCHTDNLRSKSTLYRMPQITRNWPLENEITVIGTAYGGLVYVVVPWGASLGDITVTIAGAVESLIYRHKHTTLAEWSAMVSNSAVTATLPMWGELVSDKYVLSLPITDLIQLQNPIEIMNYWDEMIDREDWLLGYPNITGSRTWRDINGRAERFVVDVQISAGWMHSGYPVMAYLSVADEQLDITHLLSDGEWGPYHEVGHNHQWRGYVLPMTTEVGCNFFSTYIVESLNHEASAGVRTCAAEIRNYMASPDYAGLGDDPFLYLAYFTTWKNEFGWTALHNVLRSYSNGDGSLDNLSSEDRVDAFMIKMSQEGGKSVEKWADAWGVPLKNQTRHTLRLLPDWDYEATLDHYEEELNPVRDCYTPSDKAWTPVHYDDERLPPEIWRHSSYRGKVNITEGGFPCQRWDMQTPNSHSYTASRYPCEDLTENYCRDTGEPRPWCYTIGGPRWQYCNVPVCEDPLVARNSFAPTMVPTTVPTHQPTRLPTTIAPTPAPSTQPTGSPTTAPSVAVTIAPTPTPIPPLILDHANLLQVKAFQQTSLLSIGAAKCRRLTETTVKYKRIFFTSGIVASPPPPQDGAIYLSGRINGVLSVEDPRPTGPAISSATLITFVLYDGNNKSAPLFKYSQQLTDNTMQVQSVHPIKNRAGDFKFQFDLENLVGQDGTQVRFPVGGDVKIEIELANKPNPDDEKSVLDCVRLGILRY